MRNVCPRPSSARAVYLVAGTAISTYGYLLTVRAELGSGPLFAAQDGLQLHLGLSRSWAAIALGCALAALGMALRAPLGVGTLVVPLSTGAWIALLEPLTPTVAPGAWRWALFVLGTAVMMLGAALIVDAALGATAMDAVMVALGRVSGRRPAAARLAMEGLLAVGGAAVGGQVRAGTIVMGLTVGPFYALWRRELERVRRVTGRPPRTTDERTDARSTSAVVGRRELGVEGLIAGPDLRTDG